MPWRGAECPGEGLDALERGWVSWKGMDALEEWEALLVLLWLEHPLHPCPIPQPDFPRKGKPVSSWNNECLQPQRRAGGKLALLQAKPKGNGISEVREGVRKIHSEAVGDWEFIQQDWEWPPTGNGTSAGDAKDAPGRAQGEGPALGWGTGCGSRRDNKVMSFGVMGLISPHRNKSFPSPQ